MSKIFNFGAGPAKLPEEVYEIIKNELTNFEDSGISLLETSHRTPKYMNLNTEVQNVVRRLLDVPANYKILFIAGGGLGQFAAIPLNLISRTGTADYVVTGAWSAKAAKEAKKYGKVNMVIPPTDKYTDIPRQSEWKLDPNASYVHICTNETIHGVEFDFIPDCYEGVPLVADMSSNFMSKKVDVSKFGVIYGGAQKNIGTSGVALVIVREDLLNKALPVCPSLLDWSAVSKMDSILNTPPMFAIYIMGRVLQWIERQGGLDAMEKNATKKSSLVYSTIENSNGFYYLPVASRVRSKMNIPFRIGNPGNDALEKEFLKGADAAGLIQLKGHRDVGGIRASTYNAVTIEEVEALTKYMTEFHKKHSK